MRGLSAGLLAYLGHLRWFYLLQRGKLAFYSALYRESADWTDWDVRPLPSDALCELSTGVVLAPFWGVDMRLPHLMLLGATDASSEIGLGGCMSPVDAATITNLAKAAERDGQYVTLEGIESKPRGRSLGTPCCATVGLKPFHGHLQRSLHRRRPHQYQRGAGCAALCAVDFEDLLATLQTRCVARRLSGCG